MLVGVHLYHSHGLLSCVEYCIAALNIHSEHRGHFLCSSFFAFFHQGVGKQLLYVTLFISYQHSVSVCLSTVYVL